MVKMQVFFLVLLFLGIGTWAQQRGSPFGGVSDGLPPRGSPESIFGPVVTFGPPLFLNSSWNIPSRLLTSKRSAIAEKFMRHLGNTIAIQQILQGPDPSSVFEFYNPRLLRKNVAALTGGINDFAANRVESNLLKVRLLPPNCLSILLSFLNPARITTSLQTVNSNLISLSLMGIGCEDLNALATNQVIPFLRNWKNQFEAIRKFVPNFNFPINIRVCGMEAVLRYLGTKRGDNGTNVLNRLEPDEIDAIQGAFFTAIPKEGFENIPTEIQNRIVNQIAPENGRRAKRDVNNFRTRRPPPPSPHPSQWRNRYSQPQPQHRNRRQAPSVPFQPMPMQPMPPRSRGQMGPPQMPQSRPSQAPPMRPPQMGKPQMSPMGQPQMSQMGQHQMSQMGQPQMSPMGQPQMMQMGQPQMMQMGQPQMTQMGQPQMSQMGQPQMMQMGQPQMSQMGPSQTPQMGQPQMSQMGPSQTPQMGPSQTSQVAPPQMSQMGPPQILQMGQPQTPQTGPPQTSPIGQPALSQRAAPDMPQTPPPEMPQMGPQFNLSTNLTVPNNLDVLSILGLNVRDEESLKAIAKKFSEDNNLFNPQNGTSRASDIRRTMWSLGSIICGFDNEVLKTIFNEAQSLFLELSPMLGKLHGCGPDTRAIMAHYAIQTNDYGAPETWTKEDVNTIGMVVAGLTPEVFMTIQPLSMLGLTSQAAGLLTPEHVKKLSPGQLRNFSFEAGSELASPSNQLMSALTPEQLTALSPVIHISREALGLPPLELAPLDPHTRSLDGDSKNGTNGGNRTKSTMPIHDNDDVESILAEPEPPDNSTKEFTRNLPTNVNETHVNANGTHVNGTSNTTTTTGPPPVAVEEKSESSSAQKSSKGSNVILTIIFVALFHILN